MSDTAAKPEKQEEAPKKKGKLPLILVLAIVLGGGGFFGMKMKGGGGGEKKKPEVKLGIIEPLQEFLVNLKDGRTYLRAEIAVHLKEGYKKEELTKYVPAVRDTVIEILTAKGLSDIQSVDGKNLLKRELAAAVNETLNKIAPPEDKKKGKPGKNEKSAEKKEPEHPDWDSDEGPILKIYFTNFATQ